MKVWGGGGSGHDDVIFCSEGGGWVVMTDNDAGGEGVKNGDFWMTSFVNDP